MKWTIHPLSTAVHTLSRNSGLNRRANTTAEYLLPHMGQDADANLFPQQVRLLPQRLL